MTRRLGIEDEVLSVTRSRPHAALVLRHQMSLILKGVSITDVLTADLAVEVWNVPISMQLGSDLEVHSGKTVKCLGVTTRKGYKKLASPIQRLVVQVGEV